MDQNSPKAILIVEDEPHVLKALSSKLSHLGFNVLAAKNGEDGLELAIQKHPDLILTNIVMPKMDGLTMVKKIRQNKWGKFIPIIFLSNLHAKNFLKKSIEEFKPCLYLVKSQWKLQDVADKIKEMLTLKK